MVGPDESGLKFAGQADMRFGASPRLRSTLTARQLDADRFLSHAGAAAPSPAELLSNLRSLIAAAPPMPMLSEFDIDAEVVNLGARPVQAIALDLRANAKEWWVDKFEFRAPGSSRVAITGRISEPGDKASFAGSLELSKQAIPKGSRSGCKGKATTPIAAKGR